MKKTLTFVAMFLVGCVAAGLMLPLSPPAEAALPIATAPAQGHASGPAGDFPDNPYCDVLPTFPWRPECPPEKPFRDQVCADGCEADWTSACQALYDFACQQYNSIVSTYAATINNYSVGVRACLANAQGDLAAREACWETYDVQCQVARVNAQAQIDLLGAAISEAITGPDGLDDAFHDCMLECCHPLPPEPEPEPPPGG